MISTNDLIVTVKRLDIPTIYLDTCAMIELCRFENGKCTSKHKDKISRLYTVLSEKRQHHQVICILGNQLDEMGMTRGRKQARDSLYKNTDAEFLHSESINIKQLQLGYQAFKNSDSRIVLSADAFINDNTIINSRLKIHVAPVISSEKAEGLKREKINISDALNELKKVKIPYEKRLMAELNADFLLFYNNAINNDKSSQKKFDYYLEEMEKFYRITSFSPDRNPDELLKELASYASFLTSSYHHLLPYIDIGSTLWANLINRQNNTIPSDWLDNLWASGFLPFSNYIVTDNSLCALLKNSGLLTKYDTKAYTLSTLDALIEKL